MTASIGSIDSGVWFATTVSSFCTPSNTGVGTRAERVHHCERNGCQQAGQGRNATVPMAFATSS